jgi:hypothetical protein
MGKDLQRSGLGLMELLSQNLYERTGKTTNDPNKQECQIRMSTSKTMLLC